MKIAVEGLDNPSQGIDVRVEVDPAGEKLPEVRIVATGGKLDVYKSRVQTSGNISVHLFAEGKHDP